MSVEEIPKHRDFATSGQAVADRLVSVRDAYVHTISCATYLQVTLADTLLSTDPM